MPLLIGLAVAPGCSVCPRCSAAEAAGALPVRVTGCVVDPQPADALRRLVFLPVEPDPDAKPVLRWTVVSPEGRFVVYLPAGRYRAELHESGRDQPLAAYAVDVSEARRQFQFQMPASPATH